MAQIKLKNAVSRERVCFFKWSIDLKNIKFSAKEKYIQTDVEILKVISETLNNYNIPHNIDDRILPDITFSGNVDVICEKDEDRLIIRAYKYSYKWTKL